MDLLLNNNQEMYIFICSAIENIFKCTQLVSSDLQISFCLIWLQHSVQNYVHFILSQMLSLLSGPSLPKSTYILSVDGKRRKEGLKGPEA